jgi:beta-glucosidase
MAYFWKHVTEDLDHPHIVGLLEGMKGRLPEGMNIMYSRGCDWTEEVETKLELSGDERAWRNNRRQRRVDSGEVADKEEALRMAAECDIIVAAMGENVLLCGENRDRDGLRLPGKQEEYVEELLATGKPVILVMFGGRAQVVSGLAERCAAVIQAWYPGEEGGNAVADILYGNVSPSAKLSVSYPNEEVYEAMCYNYSAEKDPRVAWPFGYGLSYTEFEYGNLKVDSSASTSDKTVDVSFEVTNVGSVASDEVAQVYVSPTEEGQNIRPIQLQGFARVSLQPGETKTVKVKLQTEQFGYYTNDGVRQWNIAPGTFEVKIGASSADIRLSDKVTLKGKHVTKPLREYYFSEVSVK